MPVSPAPSAPVRAVPADVLRRFYDSVPLLMGVVEIHRDDILHVTDNAATAAFFGTTPDALQGRLASELGVSATDRARWLRHYRQSRETGASVRFRYPHDGPGRRYWLEATVSYLGPGPSGVDRYAYYVEDVTAQVKQHAELLLNETRQEALLRALPDLLLRLDDAGRYLDVHAPDPAALPAPAETLFGRTLHEVLPAKLADRLYAAVQRALTTGDVALVDYDLATESGERRYFEARVSPDTEHDEVLVLVRDQTERQRNRLDALRRSGLLSPGTQEKYDRFVRLAARLLDVPTALISVVEPHRQFFTSAVGLPEPLASQREAPLSHSFCQHVVTSEAPLVVEDARHHPLVADNGAVRDLGVIAYLGAPICSPEGEVLGSLCAIDGEPRAWTAEDVSILEDLATTLADTLMLEQTAETLLEMDERLEAKEQALAAEAATAEATRTDLAQQSTLLRTALDGAPLVLYAFDADGVLTLSRGKALAALGLTDGEVIGQSVWDFFEVDSEGAHGTQRVLDGHPATWTHTYGGEWFETTAFPTEGGGIAVAALVTERVRAEQRAEAQTENLHRLVRAAAVQGSFDERAAAVLQEVTDMLGLGGGLLARIEDDTYTCLAGYAASGDTLAPGDTLPLGDTYCDLTMSASDMVVVEHMAQSEYRTHRCYEAVGLEAYIGVPVCVDGEAIGALSFSSTRPASRPFTETDRELVRLAGQWAGALLEREIYEHAIENQLERLRALADAFALRTVDDHDTLAGVLDRLRDLLGLDVGIVSRITTEDETYEVLACAVPDGVAMERGDVFALGETYCSIAIERGSVLAIDHMEVSEHHRHPCYEAFGLETYLGAPVHVDGGLYGTISFSSSTPRTTPFSDADQDLVLLMARWVGGLLAATLSAERQAEAERQLREREAQLALILEALPDALVFADAERRIQTVNPAFTRLLGYAPEDVVGATTRHLYAEPEAFDRMGRERFHTAGAVDFAPYTIQYRRKDGGVFTGETVGTPVLAESGDVKGFIGIVRDITERERQARELARSEARYRLLAENMNDLVCLHAPDGTYEWVSPSVESILGYAPQELIGIDPYTLFHPEDAERIEHESHERLVQGEESDTSITYRIRHKDGHWIWLETLTQALLDDEGEVERLQTASRDVTERHEMADRLYHQAHHDALTDLPNRLLFADRLEEAIARAKAEEALGDCNTFAVLFLDLDRFKVVNDSLGHTAGDRLLQEVGKRLQQELRPGDTVARIGGDEFAVLLCDLPDPTHAERVAERICKALRVPVRVDGQDLFAGASIGIVAGRPDHDTADAVLREADLAMYEAKAAGRDGYATFSVDVSDTASRRLRLEMDLRHAAERGELRAAYQPVVRLSDGALTGFEALVRWQHPEFGLLYPGAFIEFAEESGQVALIDRWILEEASRQTTQWREMFDDRPLLVLNVNCSSRDLIEEGYAEHVRRILDTQRFAPDRLLLEITESLLVEDTERAAAELQRLRDRGVRFCIDDFGTGYSSLSTLHALPIDTIKVDRSFVNEMDVRSQSRKLVETVVRLGRLLDKSVVAEGIETPAQLAVLRQMGCEFGQGYLFARPLAPEAATALIADTPPWHEHWTDAEDVATKA